ncbi:MAG: M23 family metallopeptidase [Oscillospiraceae bacterium]|jgi:hypothetical protein|nr:M23 family metallopeptidase [Oscillospiraceae bacterium]
MSNSNKQINRSKVTSTAISIFIVLAILITVAIPLVNTTNVSAATYSSELYDALKGKFPMVTYAMPASGASRVYAYSDSSLSTKQTNYYIDTFSDQIVINKISSDGKAVYVTYPSSSSSSGYRTKYFRTDDVIGLSSVSKKNYTATVSSTTYRLKSSSSVTSYGSIAKNDACIRLGNHKIGNYYSTVYPISSTTVNKVSGVKHKLALSKSSSSTTTTKTTTTTKGLLFPLKGSIARSSSVKTNGYYCDYITGGSKAVYAPTNGTVVFKQSSTNGVLTSYGNWIEFKSADNQYVIKLAHLNSFNNVALIIPATKTKQQSGSNQTKTLATRSVKQGDLLGYSGYTGNASGHHLHIEIKKNGTSINPITAFSAW